MRGGLRLLFVVEKHEAFLTAIPQSNSLNSEKVFNFTHQDLLVWNVYQNS